MEALITILVSFFLIIIAILYFSFSWGLVMWKFWYWFLLPVFTGLPHITFIQAIGLVMIIELFKSTTTYKYEYKGIEVERNHDWANLIYPFVTLFIGWVIHLFLY